MTVPFNKIPSDIRVPLAYVEFDNAGALKGTPVLEWRTLFIGQKLPSGTAKAGEAVRITRRGEAARLFGEGSMLASMLEIGKTANSFMETWAIALNDDASNVAATVPLKVLTAATGAGTLSLLIGGTHLQVGVAAADTATVIAAKIASKIMATPSLPVTAVAAAGVVTLTAKHKGEVGNGIDVLVNFYAGEQLPAGVTLELKPLSGGTGNPDITLAIAGFGDEWWKSIVMPYTDALNMKRLETELQERWGPMRMNDGLAWSAYRGTLAQAANFGNSHNGHLMSTMATNLAPQPPYLWASVYAVVAGTSLAIDPARPLQTLVLPGILPPQKSVRWSREECDLLLHDGMATHTVAPGDDVMIQREITMYQQDAYGMPDTSYLDVQTPATLSYIRYGWVQRVQKMFGRHKLGNDGTRYAPGQPIVTPKILTTQALAYFTELEKKGLVENFEQYKATLIVERNADNPNRLDMLGHPDLINQFRIMANQVQFIV
ncbi:phage tail sheath subtilisin-like domain-containing protein [Aeromonas veronii]|uniref:phage tail sheath subtilisin-like domain-containing protein n=1 Tax=Aeromonas veronii TaxID=654 RepID=UPI003D20D166